MYPDKRRHYSGLKRIEKAFQYFFDNQIFERPVNQKWNYKTTRVPKIDATQIQYYFSYQGVDHRLDYEIDWNKPLPKVSEIRQFVWDSLFKSTI